MVLKSWVALKPQKAMKSTSSGGLPQREKTIGNATNHYLFHSLDLLPLRLSSLQNVAGENYLDLNDGLTVNGTKICSIDEYSPPMLSALPQGPRFKVGKRWMFQPRNGLFIALAGLEMRSRE